MIAAAVGSRTVLIASAATEVRDRFAEALLQAGHRTLTVARTSDLLGSVGTARPGVDLLLLDLGLGGGNGVALVRRIRDHAGSLPVIVFSGTPLRSRGMKCQSKRSSPSKGNRTAVACSVLRLSRNAAAAVVMAAAGASVCREIAIVPRSTTRQTTLTMVRVMILPLCRVTPSCGVRATRVLRCAPERTSERRGSQDDRCTEAVVGRGKKYDQNLTQLSR